MDLQNLHNINLLRVYRLKGFQRQETPDLVKKQKFFHLQHFIPVISYKN